MPDTQLTHLFSLIHFIQSNLSFSLVVVSKLLRGIQFLKLLHETFMCFTSFLLFKGTPLTSLKDAVETLKYLYRMSQRNLEVALNLLTFYKHALTAGTIIWMDICPNVLKNKSEL